MPISETLHIVNLTPVILKTFWSIYSRWEWTGNLILGESESFAGTWVMSFQMGIGCLGGTVFFQVGLCTPLQTMMYHKWQSYDIWFLRYEVWQTEFFVILDHYLPFYPPNNLKNQNFEKLKKTPGKKYTYHHFTEVYQKSWSCAILFLRYVT